MIRHKLCGLFFAFVLLRETNGHHPKRLTESEKFDFVIDSLVWMKGYNIMERDGCFVMNFGHLHSVPYPTISWSFKKDFKLNVGSLGNQSPNRCNIILIGGDFLDHVDEVMQFVDDIQEDIQFMSTAAFIFPKNNDPVPFNKTIRDNMAPAMFQVPRVKSWGRKFIFTCPGMSYSTTFELNFLSTGSVDNNKKFGDLCRRKIVRIAYNNEPKAFEMNEDESDFVRKKPYLRKYMKNNIIWDWEILDTWIRQYDIDPIWINNFYNWGTFMKDKGVWSGAIGKIEADLADFAVYGFGCTYARTFVVTCMPGITYQPYYYWSRFPLPVSPTWNLVRLYNPTVWMWSFISLISVVIFLYVSSFTLKKFCGMNVKQAEILLWPFRAPQAYLKRPSKEIIKKEKTTFFSRGFSYNIVFGVWIVFGTFSEHMLLCNFLGVMLQPTYEQPVKYAHEIYDRGMRLYGEPKAQIWKQILSDAPTPMYKELGEKMYLPSDWDEFFNISANEVMKQGKYALLQSILEEKDLKHNWWRSTDTMPGKPAYLGGGYVNNKKWPLVKLLNHHIIVLQQAGLVRNPVPFFPKTDDDDELQKLRMEHIYLPLMILGGGIVSGFFALIFEKIYFCSGLGEDKK